MNDVDARAGLASGRAGSRDRTPLDERRPRRRPRSGVTPALTPNAPGRLAHERLVFRMQGDEQTGLRRGPESRHELVVRERRKLRNAAVAEEGLAPDRAATLQLVEAHRIRVDQSTPETEVDD